MKTFHEKGDFSGHMSISFKSLQREDFVHLVQWLQTPHVSKWWPTDSVGSGPSSVTFDWVERKYSDYVIGFKQVDNDRWPIYAYIFYLDRRPIGYLQFYDLHDFLGHKYHPLWIPDSVGGVDMYIGEENLLGQGIGPAALSKFLDEILFLKFDYAFVDPQSQNHQAIRAYKKIGFTECTPGAVKTHCLMLKPKVLMDKIEQLERKLLQPMARHSKKTLEHLIANDFREVGQSGKRYGKQEVLKALLQESSRDFKAQYFEVKQISSSVCMVWYYTQENGGKVFRTSLWKLQQDKWQMIFHQGTPIQKE